jgi:cyclophilin family peptidyl-prolyl cis-trans isomerase
MKSIFLVLFPLLLELLAQRSPAGTIVEFELTSTNQILGVVDVELYDQDKPVTVNNFLNLIESGAFENSFFHRTAPGFVLQGGGYFVFNPSSTLPMTNTFAEPPVGNLGVVDNFGTITGEANVGTFYSNTNGTIAMALTTGPDTATSQFFFNLTNNNGTTPGEPNLDNSSDRGPFTVFGHVINGMALVSEIANTFPQAAAVGGGPFTDLPVFPTVPYGTYGPPYDDLIYYNIRIVVPSLKIASPAAGFHASNALLTVTGTAGAASGISGVWCQINNGAFNLANTTNGYTNWTATLPLIAGENTINAYAEDQLRNFSLVTSVNVISSNTFLLQLSAPNSSSSLGGGFGFYLQISPGLNGHIQYSTNLSNWITLTNFVGTNTTIPILDPDAGNDSGRFYRAIIP